MPTEPALDFGGIGPYAGFFCQGGKRAEGPYIFKYEATFILPYIFKVK